MGSIPICSYCIPKPKYFFYESSDSYKSSSEDSVENFMISYYEKTNVSLYEKQEILEAELMKIRSKIHRRVSQTSSKSTNMKDVNGRHKRKKHKKRRRKYKQMKINTEPKHYSSTTNNTPVLGYQITSYENINYYSSNDSDLQMNMKMNVNMNMRINQQKNIPSSPMLTPSPHKSHHTRFQLQLQPMEESDIELHPPGIDRKRVSADMDIKAWNLFNENPQALFIPSPKCVNQNSMAQSASNIFRNRNVPQLNPRLNSPRSQPMHRKTNSCYVLPELNEINSDGIRYTIVEGEQQMPIRKRCSTVENSVIASFHRNTNENENDNKRVSFLRAKKSAYELKSTESSNYTSEDSESSDDAINHALVEEWKRGKSMDVPFKSSSCRMSSKKKEIVRLNSCNSSEFPFNSLKPLSIIDTKKKKKKKKKSIVNEESDMEILHKTLAIKAQLSIYEELEKYSNSIGTGSSSSRPSTVNINEAESMEWALMQLKSDHELVRKSAKMSNYM